MLKNSCYNISCLLMRNSYSFCLLEKKYFAFILEDYFQ